MSARRYRYDPSEECFNEHERGNVIFWKDHQEMVNKHEKTIEGFVNIVEGLMETIDAQSVDINCLNRLKPSKQDMYLVQWWYEPGKPIMVVKHYDDLENFLAILSEDSSITDITVCALHPVKVTTKKVLTVEL